MLQSLLRSPRTSHKRPVPFRPTLESLDGRIVPAAHFNSATSSINSAGELVVDFKEAGLGDTVTIDYTLTANGDGQYQWFNHGGNKPQGQPFQADPVIISAGGSFASGKNGQITATITATGQVPPPPQDFLDSNHAANWVPKLTVSYTNIVLTDTTNNVTPDTQPADVSATVVVTLP
jgi:hypothetical protein